MDNKDNTKQDDIKTGEFHEMALPMPIEWNIPDTIITRFASNMAVQHMEGCFKISFFEMKPAIHLVPPTPEQQQHAVKADCVASVIVTAEKFAIIVGILQKTLDKYHEKIKAN
jgi:hypothetical protein